MIQRAQRCPGRGKTFCGVSNGRLIVKGSHNVLRLSLVCTPPRRWHSIGRPEKVGFGDEDYYVPPLLRYVVSECLREQWVADYEFEAVVPPMIFNCNSLAFEIQQYPALGLLPVLRTPS